MNIFVAKLDYNTTTEALEDLFLQYGNVSSCKIIMDKETGRSKGYGFVEMDDDDEALNAIELLNDSEFDGRTIVVKKAEPPQKKSFNRGGGGGYQRRDGGGGYQRRDGGGGYQRRDGGGYRSRDNDGGGYRRRDNDGGGYRRRDNDGGGYSNRDRYNNDY